MRRVDRAVVALAVVALSLATSPVGAQDVRARVARVLKATPLIDGHNDWPEVIREREGEARWTVDLRSRLGTGDRALQHRYRPAAAGHGRGTILVRVGLANLPGPEQVKQTLEQIALVQSFAERYPDTFAMARTARMFAAFTRADGLHR